MVIVQTTVRKGVSYLANTLKSIGKVGERKKIVVSDGPVPVDFVRPDDWYLLEYPWRGARLTGWTCMRLAADALDEGESLILLQDDLAVCDGGGDVMDKVETPDNAIATSFFSPSALPSIQPKDKGVPRFIVIGASGTAQALKLPRRSLEYLCGKDPRHAPNHIQDGPHLFDDSLFAFARESPWPHVAHLVPNIVRHVGDVSACGTRRPFRQPWRVEEGEHFPGDVANLGKYEILYTHPASPWVSP